MFAEKANLLRRVVVDNFEVAFLEIRNQFVAAVENGEQDVDEIDFPDESGGLLSIGGRRCGRLLLSGRLRFLRRLLRVAGERKCEQREAGDQGDEWTFHDEKV